MNALLTQRVPLKPDIVRLLGAQWSSHLQVKKLAYYIDPTVDHSSTLATDTILLRIVVQNCITTET